MIYNALKSLSVPVSFSKYAGTASTYITFFCYNEQGEQFADDVETLTGFYVQVDIWSKGDYSILAGQVKAAMLGAGFLRTSEADLYESETLMFHKALRFSILIES